MKEQKTQTCNKCGKTLPLNEFCKNSSRKNGHRGICKGCESIYHKNKLANLKLDPDKYEARQAIIREKARRQKGVAKGATFQQKKRCRTMWKKRYPEKYAACISCSNLPKVKGMNIHHWSYQEQHRKDFILLTTAQHALVHRFTVYDQERMMYRRLDGTLIDSREAAIAYYATLKDDTLEIFEKTKGDSDAR